MKPFALLNSLLAFFGGTVVAMAMHFHRKPRKYIMVAYAKEYKLTNTSVWVDGTVMLLLAGFGCYAALQANLKRRRIMLILYAAMMLVLLLGEAILILWLVLQAKWALRHLPLDPIDPDLKQLLEAVSLAAGVNPVVAAWVSILLLLQIGASVMAGFEARRALNKLRLQRRLTNERELTILSYS